MVVAVAMRLDAADEGRKALELVPDYHNVRCNIALALRELGNREVAVAEYEFILERDPDFLEAYGNLAVVYRELGLLNKAMDVALSLQLAQGATRRYVGNLDFRTSFRGSSQSSHNLVVSGASLSVTGHRRHLSRQSLPRQPLNCIPVFFKPFGAGRCRVLGGRSFY